MNINSNKIGDNEIPSSRTPQFAVGGSDKKDSKRSIFSTRKTPNMKSVKKEGYNRNSCC